VTGMPPSTNPKVVLEVGILALITFVAGPIIGALTATAAVTSWSWVAAFILAAVLLLRGDTVIKEHGEGSISAPLLKQLQRIRFMQSLGLIVVAITASVAVFAVIGGVTPFHMFA
jgi:MFS family permease